VGFEGANDVGWKELNFGIWVEERELNGVWVNLLFGACVVGCRVKVWVQEECLTCCRREWSFSSEGIMPSVLGSLKRYTFPALIYFVDGERQDN
jgi:hypothetical protein